jgi:hypothetical protein
MMTEEQMMARLLAARLDKPPQPAPPPNPEVKRQERWTQKDQVTVQQLVVSTEAGVEMAQRWRDRKQEQIARTDS